MSASNETTSFPTPNGLGNNPAERVVRTAHQTIDRIAEVAVPQMQRLQDTVHDSAVHAREVGQEWTDSVRGTVREHPIAAVLTALAVGVLIARLSSSR